MSIKTGMKIVDVTKSILDHIKSPSRFEIECLSLDVSESSLPIFCSLSIPSSILFNITPDKAQHTAPNAAATNIPWLIASVIPEIV